MNIEDYLNRKKSFVVHFNTNNLEDIAKFSRKLAYILNKRNIRYYYPIEPTDLLRFCTQFSEYIKDKVLCISVEFNIYRDGELNYSNLEYYVNNDPFPIFSIDQIEFEGGLLRKIETLQNTINQLKHESENSIKTS